jgi:hypothetical protein
LRILDRKRKSTARIGCATKDGLKTETPRGWRGVVLNGRVIPERTLAIK